MIIDSLHFEKMQHLTQRAVNLICGSMVQWRKMNKISEQLQSFSSYCSQRVRILLEAEETLQQKQSSFIDRIPIDYMIHDSSVRLLGPDAERHSEGRRLSAGIGAYYHFAAVRAAVGGSISMLTSSLSASIAEISVKGEAHAALLNKEGAFDPELVLEAEASVSAVQACLTASAGSSSLGVSAKAVGSIGSAGLQAEAVLTKNEQTLRLKAGAAAISGEAQCVLNIFGAKVTLSASASLGSAEAEFVYSNSNREWEFGSKLGFIAGLGFKIKVSF